MDVEARLKEHAYDGIREYDNDLPRWWLAILWLSVLFAPLYVAIYHLQPEKLGAEALRRERLDLLSEQAAKAVGPLPEELLRGLSHDPARAARGRELFAKSQCPTCHMPDATGNIGPNLRDDWWIYGSDMATIVETITEGRAGNAMPAQRQILSREDIVNLACFVAEQNRTSKAAGKREDRNREHLQPIGL
jgi:cytochrome c oxidase cbb3-type subunit 3